MMHLPKIIKPQSVYWNSFKMLYKDLEESFRFVNPSKEQLKVHSFRFYELLVRACTEFESLCKDKVSELKLSKNKSDDFNIIDFHLLNAHFENKPSRISVGFTFSDPLFVRPLEGWNASHSLGWYQAYNNVKHNRVGQFELANMENVLNSIAALFIIIERCKLCPDGNLSFYQSESGHQKAFCHDTWPVVLIKEY
jgi:hypothetical protein